MNLQMIHLPDVLLPQTGSSKRCAATNYSCRCCSCGAGAKNGEEDVKDLFVVESS